MNERDQALAIVNKALPVLQEYQQRRNEKIYLEDEDRGGFLSFIGGIIIAVITHKILRLVMPNRYFFRLLLDVVAFFAGGFAIRIFFDKKINPVAAARNREREQKRFQTAQAYLMENWSVIEPVPESYRYADAVSYFRSVLINGRADNMKEAMNLYETHLHELTMEQKADTMQKYSKQNLADNQKMLEEMAAVQKQIKKLNSTVNSIPYRY